MTPYERLLDRVEELAKERDSMLLTIEARTSLLEQSEEKLGELQVSLSDARSTIGSALYALKNVLMGGEHVARCMSILEDYKYDSRT